MKISRETPLILRKLWFNEEIFMKGCLSMPKLKIRTKKLIEIKFFPTKSSE